MLFSPITAPGSLRLQAFAPFASRHQPGCRTKVPRLVCSINPWRTLNVPRNADEKTIKRAYRKLALKHHPDVGGSAEAKQFLDIQQAYEVLIGRSRGKEVEPGSPGAGWSFHDWYWRFSTGRRAKPPPRAAGPVGAPAAQLHTQLSGLRRKAAARRRQQPPNPNPSPEPVPARAPSQTPVASSTPGLAGNPTPSPAPRGPASAASPAAAAYAATTNAASSGAAGPAPRSAGPTLRHASVSGIGANLRGAHGISAGAGSRAAEGREAQHAHAYAAAAGALASDSAPTAPSNLSDNCIWAEAGLGHHATEGLGARGVHRRGAAAGGDGHGLGHVVRCAREFLADVRSQRLSNNVVASALQGLGARIAHAAVPATSMAFSAGGAPEPDPAYTAGCAPAWAGAGAGSYAAHVPMGAGRPGPQPPQAAQRSSAPEVPRAALQSSGRAPAEQGVTAGQGVGVSSRGLVHATPGTGQQGSSGDPTPPQGSSGAAKADTHVVSQLAGLKRRAAMRRSEA